jgi:site-specific recombinase XerC
MSYVRQNARAVRTLAPAEQRKLLDVTGEHVDGFRDHVTYSVALGTALREHEIAALNVGDIARGPSEIRSRIDLRVFSKKGEQRDDKRRNRVRQRVFIPKACRLKLRKFIAWKKRKGEDVRPGAPLFMSERGTRLSERAMRYNFRVWQTRAGFDHLYTFHELRHTSLTNLYKATKDLLLVREQARHANVTTTEIYAHASDQDVRAAVDDLPS